MKVRVNVGVGVKISVDGMGANVSVEGTSVDVSTTMAEGEAVGSSPVTEMLHERVVRIHRISKYVLLYFTSSLY
jgi:hypothetical protein